MDAVQKVGNGHPGTAMSLAPAAYLLFQKVMRHNPADPDWLGRDRFVLSCRTLLHHALHPALPRRLRARARRPEGAAHLGLADPGSPRVRPHRRRRDHHRSARPGRRQRGRHGDGRPPRARSARPRRRAGREPVRPPRLRHLQRRRPARRASAPRPASLAGHQELGNLTLIYDHNRICIEGDTDIAFTEDVGKRATRPTAGTCSTSTGPTPRRARTTTRTSRRSGTRSQQARQVTDQPSLIVLHTIIAWPAPERAEHRQGARLRPRRGRGRRDQEGPRRSTREQTFEVPRDVLAHTRGSAPAAEPPRPSGTRSSAPGPRPTP